MLYICHAPSAGQFCSPGIGPAAQASPRKIPAGRRWRSASNRAKPKQNKPTAVAVALAWAPRARTCMHYFGCHERNAWLHPQRQCRAPPSASASHPWSPALAVRLAVNNNNSILALCILIERLILVLYLFTPPLLLPYFCFPLPFPSSRFFFCVSHTH